MRSRRGAGAAALVACGAAALLSAPAHAGDALARPARLHYGDAYRPTAAEAGAGWLERLRGGYRLLAGEADEPIGADEPTPEDAGPDEEGGLLDAWDDGPPPVDPERTPEQLEANDATSLRLPRLRVEANFRTMALVTTRAKHGRQALSGTITARTDLHLPAQLALGYRFLAELKLHPQFVVGGQYTRVLAQGPPRFIHHTGVRWGGYDLPGGIRARTELDLQFSEVYVRYVIRDKARVRLMFGFGAAWASFHLGAFAFDRHALGRVEGFFGPTVSYMLQVELVPPLHVFLESVSALIAPSRFPSYASDLRVGFRIALGLEFELMCAASVTSAQIADTRDLWGRKNPPTTHIFREASWTLVGGDFGLALRW